MEKTGYSYFEEKKRQNLILTDHTLNSKKGYDSMRPPERNKPVEYEGISRWSRLSGRYRDADGQKDFLRNGCRDRDFGPVKSFSDEKPAEGNTKKAA